MTKPIAFPDDSNTHWWMRFKMKPRGKWRVMLVSVIESAFSPGEKYIEPFGDNNAFARSIVESWQAQFLPAESPPDDDKWCSNEEAQAKIPLPTL